MLLEIIELARQHDLIIYADEIYDKTLYDLAEHVSIASLADDVLIELKFQPQAAVNK